MTSSRSISSVVVMTTIKNATVKKGVAAIIFSWLSKILILPTILFVIIECHQRRRCFRFVCFSLLSSRFFLLISAVRMAEAEKHCTVDAVLSNIQETEVPLGTTCWPPG